MKEKRITIAIKATLHKKASIEKVHTGVSIAAMMDRLVEHYFSLPAEERRALLKNGADS